MQKFMIRFAVGALIGFLLAAAIVAFYISIIGW